MGKSRASPCKGSGAALNFPAQTEPLLPSLQPWTTWHEWTLTCEPCPGCQSGAVCGDRLAEIELCLGGLVQKTGTWCFAELGEVLALLPINSLSSFTLKQPLASVSRARTLHQQ